MDLYLTAVFQLKTTLQWGLENMTIYTLYCQPSQTLPFHLHWDSICLALPNQRLCEGFEPYDYPWLQETNKCVEVMHGLQLKLTYKGQEDVQGSPFSSGGKYVHLLRYCTEVHFWGTFTLLEYVHFMLLCTSSTIHTTLKVLHTIKSSMISL